MQKLKTYGCIGAIAGMFGFLYIDTIRAAMGKETYTEKVYDILSTNLFETYNIIKELI